MHPIYPIQMKNPMENNSRLTMPKIYKFFFIIQWIHHYCSIPSTLLEVGTVPREVFFVIKITIKAPSVYLIIGIIMAMIIYAMEKWSASIQKLNQFMRRK